MTYCLFPWLGTRSFRTLRKLLTKHARELQISNLEFEGCYYITFRYDGGDPLRLGGKIRELMAGHIDRESLIAPSDTPIFEKFDPYLPRELLCRAYAEDRLRVDEINAASEHFRF